MGNGDQDRCQLRHRRSGLSQAQATRGLKAGSARNPMEKEQACLESKGVVDAPLGVFTQLWREPLATKSSVAQFINPPRIPVFVLFSPTVMEVLQNCWVRVIASVV